MFDSWSDWFVLACLVMQWGVVFKARARHRQIMADMQQLRECWRLLNQCTKVLDMHSDFDSRYLRGQIRDLTRKYMSEDDDE